MIEKDNVVKEELTTYFKSVILFGKARVLEKEDEIFHAAEILGLKYYEDQEAVDKEVRRELKNLCCVEIAVEHVTGKEAIELTRARKNF